jgi:predicted amino acid racemase
MDSVVVYPYLSVDLDAIEQNARAIVGLCAEHGIAVTGVTKGVCGNAEIAKAMLRGGVASLADSRLENIARLRVGGIDVPITLLRLAPLSGVEEVAAAAGASLNSEIEVVAGLSEAALRQGVIHGVFVMVDLGDLREGLWPDDLVPFVGRALALPGIRIAGLGANLACLGGVVPSADNMSRLVELAEEVERTFSLELELISGVNSSGLELIAAGRMPARINHARIGEAILLGRETVRRRPWPGTRQDAFVLRAEILECKLKPSVPIGETAEDAFGRRPAFEDRGKRVRALLNVGREDVDVGVLTPLDPGVTIVGASSGYLVADVTDARTGAEVGDELAFQPGYGALLAAMTSEYVKKRLTRGGESVAAEGGDR